MIWLNGRMFDEPAPVFRPNNRGILLADGLFETVKVKYRVPLFLTEHLCRLRLSCGEFNLPVETEMIRSGLKELLSKVSPEFCGSLRISVFRGEGPRGMAPIPRDEQSPDVLLTLEQASGKAASSVARLVVSPFSRSPDAPSTRMKTLSYTDNLMAREYAARAGADDALFLSADRGVTSTTMANVFLYDNGVYLTPPLSEGILPGVVRAQILREAARRDLKIRVQRFSLAQAKGKWLFRTNSLLGVTPAYIMDPPREELPADPMPSELLSLYDDAEERELSR